MTAVLLDERRITHAVRRLSNSARPETTAAALRRGEALEEVLREANVDARVVEAIRLAGVTDPAPALEAIASALERYTARLASAKASAAYAVLVAAISSVASFVLLRGAIPALGVVRDAEVGGVSADLSAAPLAVVVGSFALCAWLAWSVRSPEPRFPVREARRAALRAVFLTAAAALSKQVPLPQALRGAARLTRSRRAIAEAEQVAATLQDAPSDLPPGAMLLGDVGASLFAAAARSGAGSEALGALAELHETTAAIQLAGALRRAELLAVACSGASLAVTGGTYMATYSRFLLGGG